MKNLLKVLFLFVFTIKLCSQTEINLDNNISGIYSNSNQKKIDFSCNGINYLSYKKLYLNSNTFYLISMRDKETTGNEFIQRTTIDYQPKKISYFIYHQYSSSLIRNINSENWFGLGAGFKKNIRKSTIGFSYSVMQTIVDKKNNIPRHSVRIKYKIEKKLFSINTEYFFQPSILVISDYIIIGNTTLIFLPEKKVNLVLQDLINIRSTEEINTIHTITIGLRLKMVKIK